MKRSQVPQEITWDLTDLYPDEASFEGALESLIEDGKKLEGKDLVAMELEELAEFLESYQDFQIKMRQVSTFSFLDLSVDRTNDRLQKRESKVSNITSKLMTDLAYIQTDIQKVDEDKLKELADGYPQFLVLVRDLLRDRPHLLDEATEKALVALNDALYLPYEIYNMIKLADMKFEGFEVEGKTYPMSYILYENDYCQSPDTALRRAAYDSFYDTIGSYSFGMGTGYLNHIKKEKVLSQLRGYDSVSDYLLAGQDVPREIYDLHLETMMNYLSPVMQKYAGFLKDYYDLDELLYADLKALIDPDFAPETTIEMAKEDARAALKPLGKEYSSIIDKALDERWIDFAQNEGKSTGGFCASPYGNHSYILMTWTGFLADTYTLAHELGHAGHFQLAGRNQSMFNVRTSTYLVEAPSTCNELFLTDYLFEKEDSPRNKRYVIASFLGNTYYHNFVTHFLEAYFQKEVYDSIDREKSLTTQDLHRIKKEVLEKFWGDSVTVDDKAGYTWMRQPHYYMGLYPYTYSAGLSLATNVFLKIKSGELTTQVWLDFLQAGGTKTPVELAQVLDIDLYDNKSLRNSIAYVESLVDELISLSEDL